MILLAIYMTQLDRGGIIKGESKPLSSHAGVSQMVIFSLIQAAAFILLNVSVANMWDAADGTIKRKAMAEMTVGLGLAIFSFCHSLPQLQAFAANAP
ncbi:MAG: hypothetical protein PW788_06110 [Micavibrio sp.]|nr:hypothetical protein [Micavibrio sp.]